MKSSTLSLHICLYKSTNLTNPTANSPFLIPIKTTPYLKLPAYTSTASGLPSKTTTISSSIEQLSKTSQIGKPLILEFTGKCQKPYKGEIPQFSSNDFPRNVILGAVSIGFVLFLMGVEDHKALAFGPEGPLVEEFWDNVRRYGLYALTVSTGAIYTILLPILELLKNPISAILLLAILGGGFYIVSQVLSAMLLVVI
ncbi:DUF751 domain-containing protein [Cephalotus follicularis]|uniref:Uncharacterized protein ycf33 n=1 Tax=Cephalotus follicularis TaxID=3775 RepID=A0A1Q3AWC0_CEPFO|nr:DUF751 domain-containing protein [Cephalotus follicularis]